METFDELYYREPYTREFDASVVSCEPADEGFAIELDQTAFYPTGGGQPGDRGTLSVGAGEDSLVAHVREAISGDGAGEVIHLTDIALPVGASVHGSLDWPWRRDNMEAHTGEHIVSGIVHALFGYNNVGFHMGERCIEVDFDGLLTDDDVLDVERRANAAIREDVSVEALLPSPAELAAMDYRSKKDHDGQIRVVRINGVDFCACCGTHVSSTGQVGLIKILSAERHRGGVRITALCGMDAYGLAARQQESVTAISGLLSVPRDAIVPGVERLLELQTAQKERIAALSLELARLRAESAENTEGNLVLFDSVLDEVAQRELVNLLMEKCAVAAVFSGSDGEGWRYVIGSRSADLRKNSRAINAGIQGRGGGSPRMIQGRAAADSDSIRAFFESWKSEA